MVGQEATSEAGTPAVSTTTKLIDDEDLRRLFDYWRVQRRGRRMPSRGDIDPLDIGWALSRIFLVDYTAAEGLVYRLAGADIASVFGRGNLKGLQPRDFLPPDRADAIEAAFMRVIEEPAVMVMRGMVYLRADRLPMGERIFLPLANRDKDAANGVLGMTVVHSETTGVPTVAAHAMPNFIPVDDIP
jgi:hypothetical protein